MSFSSPGPLSPRHLQVRRAIPTVAIMLAALLLRLIQLEGRPLWYDEAFAVLISRGGPGAILEGTLTTAGGSAADVHPPLYYTILWGWMLLFGESVLAVRLLSVIFSLICLILVGSIAGFAFDRKTGQLTAALFALSPFQIHYGQEARMYVLLSLLLMLATWFCLKTFKNTGWGTWIGLSVVSALAMYTHVLAAFYLLPLYGMTLFMRDRKRLVKLVATTTIAMALYGPWLIQLPGQISKVQTSYWIGKPGLTEALQTVVALNAGLPLIGILMPIALFLSVFLLVVLIWRTKNLSQAERGQPTGIFLFIALTLVPALLLFLVSQIWPVFIIRGLLPSGVVYLIWIAWLIGHRSLRQAERNLIGIVVLTLFIIGLYSHYSYRGFPYAPFAELDRYLESHEGDGSLILHSNKLSMIPGYYYSQELHQEYLADPPGSASDTLALPTQEVIGLIAQEDIATAVDGYEDIFFILFDREKLDYLQAGYDQHPDLQYLQEHFLQVRQIPFGDLKLYEFQRMDPASQLLPEICRTPDCGL